MSKIAQKRRRNDPDAFALTTINASSTRFDVRIFIHLHGAKIWRLYDRRSFRCTADLLAFLNELYPGITELRVNEL